MLYKMLFIIPYAQPNHSSIKLKYGLHNPVSYGQPFFHMAFIIPSRMANHSSIKLLDFKVRVSVCKSYNCVSDFPSLFMARQPRYAIFSPAILWLPNHATHMIAALFLIIFLHQRPQRLFLRTLFPFCSSSHLDFVFNAL